LLDQWEKQTAESRNFDRTVINTEALKQTNQAQELVAWSQLLR